MTPLLEEVWISLCDPKNLYQSIFIEGNAFAQSRLDNSTSRIGSTQHIDSWEIEKAFYV